MPLRHSTRTRGNLRPEGWLRPGPTTGRRRLSPLPLLLVPGLALGSCSDPAPPPESAVLVIVDSLRRDHLGLYGHDVETSTKLDALAEDGLVLELCSSPSSNSVPAMEAILAGRLLAGAEVRGAAPPLLPAALRDAGRATAWFSNADYDLDAITGAFDHADGSSTDAADALVGQALAWIAKQESPFLLVLHITEPRLPFAPDPFVRGKFTGGLGSSLTLPLQDPPTGADVPAVDRAFVSAAYDEEVAHAADQVARLVGALQSGPWAETGCLVLVTSNHGMELYERGGVGPGRSLHNEQLWVPMLVFGDAVWSRRLSVPMSTLDLYPTILEALDVAPPVGTEGVSLWPLVTGHTGTAPQERPLFAHGVHGDRESWSAFRWPWKLVRHSVDQSATLFDRSKDAGEKRDIAAEHPEVVRELLDELEARFGS